MPRFADITVAKRLSAIVVTGVASADTKIDNSGTIEALKTADHTARDVAAISGAASLMVASGVITSSAGRPVRLATSKSLGSCAGVIFTAPEPNSGSAYSSATTGMRRPVSGSSSSFPMMDAYRSSPGFTATPVSASIVSGRVVAMTSCPSWIVMPAGAKVQMLHTGVGSFANVNYNGSNGYLRVVSSSKRYKENIQSAAIDVDRVLSLEPRIFQRNDEWSDDDTPEFIGYREDNPYYTGFIAEEAHELGLTDWVEYDAEGTPVSFGYANWGVALQAVARKQRDQIEELQAENTALEDRLATLEAAVATLMA